MNKKKFNMKYIIKLYGLRTMKRIFQFKIFQV